MYSYCMWMFDGSTVNMFFQISWHIVWQMSGVIKILWYPSENFIQFKEDTWSTSVVIVKIFLNTRWPGFNVNIANLSPWRLLTIIAIINVLTAARNRTRCLVSCNKKIILEIFAFFSSFFFYSTEIKKTINNSFHQLLH